MEQVSAFPDNFFDAVFCDPPYGLRFMSKRWDYDVPAAETWRALLRVLKPGAPLLAFGGARTFHRLAVNIEDAGFELRDMLCWLYGSGFPKSLAVDKAMDRRKENFAEILEVTRWLAATCTTKRITNRQIDAHFGFHGMASHWTSAKSQPGIPTAAQWEELVRWLDLRPPRRIRDLAARLIADKGQPGEAWFARDVVGAQNVPVNPGAVDGSRPRKLAAVTAPVTAKSRCWLGYGTALKPAWEPILLARKPLDGSIAQNVARWGVGGLAIDACRIGDVSRWPANLLFDEEAGVMLDRQAGPRVSRPSVTRNGGGGRIFRNAKGSGAKADGGYTDAGGASRFFFCAKASTREREAGCDALPLRSPGECTARQDDSAGLDSPRAGAGRTRGLRNGHPTLKPLVLTKYLATLIRPPPREKGEPRRVLVPFAGAGSEMIGAVLAGWDLAVGIEREPEYVAIAQARLAHWTQNERHAA